MSIRYSYRTKGHLTLKELEGLSKLCREEEDVRWAILNANSDLSPYYCRLLTYSKKNKFKLGNFSEAPSDRYKEYKNKYHFILAKDKKDKLLGYICFEHIVLDTDEEIKDLLIIKHMYISNAVNDTRIDITMFYVLENIVSKCVIYTNKLYAVCNSFNGFSLITEPFRTQPSSAIRVKKANRFPGFEDVTLRSVLYSMGDFSQYANIGRIN